MHMKRISRMLLNLILIVFLCASLLPANALAQSSASTSGSGNSSSHFWVDARENASITLKQTKGTCTELCCTRLNDGFLSQEEEWGKYHIYMVYGCLVYTEEWDKAFNEGTFHVSLPLSGTLRIDVVPYTAQEMTCSRNLETFVEWTAAPTWWISDATNCCVTTREPSFFKPDPTPFIPNPAPNPNISVWDYPDIGYTVWLKNPYMERIRPQCGPGNDYKVFASMSGSTRLYKPSQIDWMQAHFVSGSWVYVEFSYSGNMRGGWFPQSLFYCVVPWTRIISFDMRTGGIYGNAERSVIPYNGPGYNYGEYSSCCLSSGDRVFALIEYNGWYYCRFYNNHGNNYGNVWLWVPANSVQIN